MIYLKWALIIGAIVVGLWLLDRLLLAAEARGWIYWRKKKPSPGTVGSALLELQSMVEPSKKHVQEVQQMEHTETELPGGDM
jgi:hypothetical protein